MLWMEQQKTLSATLAKLAESKQLQAQREFFFPLSQQLIQTLNTFPVPQTVYRAYCPMAFDNQGAVWLQKTNQVLNPYFGKRMLRCGEIQETMGAGHE